MRPTFRNAPAPAIPTTMVEKTSGAMIDLIRLMKRSRKKEPDFPQPGPRQPITPPTISPIMICTVKDGRYHGRRVCAAFIGSVLTQTANLKQPRFVWVAHARDACATQKDALHCCVFLTHLECTSCGLRHEWQRLQNLCTACHKPLFAIVDLTAAGRTLSREDLATRRQPLGD